jgi:signal transduction histidine kinase
MTLGAALTLAVASLAALGAIASWRLARAPIWGDLRRFAVPAGCTALYGFTEVIGQLVGSEGAFTAVHSVLGGSSVLTSWSWLSYTDAVCHRDPRPFEQRLRKGLFVLAALALVPGLAFDAAAPSLPFGRLIDSDWRHSNMTAFGVAIAFMLIALGLVVETRLLRAWRAGNRDAGLIALAFGAAIPVAFSDISHRAGWIDAHHMLALALAIPLAVAAWIVGSRFLADADSLQELRARLEGLVEARTRELAETHAALLQAEKLAALGQFAAGVAHEVNNPAAVVTANLAHLSGALARGEAAAEAKEIVDESLEAMRRINELVRKLLDAGRLADLPPSGGNVPLADAVDGAFAALRGTARSDVDLLNRVPDDLLVRGGSEIVGRILAALLSNAIEAIPLGRRGRVEVSARADSETVRVVIEDDGEGMPTDVLRRAFDPFFTTKAAGRGAGLGLPITRGLVEGIGGEIWLESSPGQGTRAAVELQAGKPA